MKVHSTLRPALAGLLTACWAGLLAAPVRATDWYWDADGDTTTATGGTGNWTLAGVDWRSGSATGTLTAYNDAAGPQNDAAANLVLAGGTDSLTLTLPASTTFNLNKLTVNNTYTLATNTGVAAFVGAAPAVSVASSKSLVWGIDLSAAGATVTKGGAGTWQFNNTAGQVTSNNTTLDITAGTLQFNTSAATANLFTGTGGVVKAGGGTTVSLLQTYNGGYIGARNWTLGSKVTLNGGALNAGSSNGALFIRLLNTTAIQVDATSTIAQSNGGYTQDFTVEGAFSGSGNLNLNRANSNTRYLSLKGDMSGYSGNVTIGASTAAGYVVFGNASGWGAGSLTLTGAGSNVLLGDEAATAYNAAWTGGSALSFVSGTLAPSAAVTVGGGANLQLMNNTASHAILFSPVNGLTVNGGTLSAKGTAGASFFVPAASSTWVFGGSALSTVSGPVRMDNTGMVFQVADAVTTGAGIDTTVTGVISGANGFTKTGAGTLALSGNNSYAGATVAQVGIVIADNSSAFGTGPVSVGLAGSASRIQLGNGVDVANALTLNAQSGVAGRGALEVTGTNAATWSGPIVISANPSAGGTFYTDAGASLTLAGPISGANPIQRAGNVTYSGGGSYTALIVTGVAKVGAPVGLASGAYVSLGASAAGTLDLNGIHQTLDGVVKSSNAATVTNSGAAPAILSLGAGTDRTYAGTIENGTGGLSLVKQGASTLTLSGNNSYAGTTSVSQGKLLVDGIHTGGGLITVSAFATLGGSGEAGDVDALDDALLAPGSAATPADNGLDLASLLLAPTTRLEFDLAAPAGVADTTNSDLITLSGNLRLDGVLHVTGKAGFETAGLGDTWLLISYGGILTNNGLTLGSVPALGGGLSFLVDTDTSGKVYLAVVPEPAAGALMLLGLALLRLRLRRR